ncbi:hypothetical protein ES707_11106 [subsurface metagenome]
MKVRVNCPIAGCGIQVNVKHLEKHLEKVHELDGELVLKLHPSTAYQHTPAADQEPEPEPEELEAIKLSPEAELVCAVPIEPEPEPEPGEE